MKDEAANARAPYEAPGSTDRPDDSTGTTGTTGVTGATGVRGGAAIPVPAPSSVSLSPTSGDRPAAPRRGRPRSEAVRQNVIRAANELLDERGFRAMTVEAIAERAGASKVTLYRWWPNKAAIVMDAFLIVTSPKIPFRRTSSALNDLREQMLSFGRLLRERSGALMIGMMAEGVFDDELNEAFRERWLGPRRTEAKKALERAIAAGDLPADLDMTLTLDLLYTPMYYRVMIKHAPLDDAFVEGLWASVMGGVATASARQTCRRLKKFA